MMPVPSKPLQLKLFLEFVLLAADYSQLDVRLVAHFSEDASLLKVFSDEKDLFRKLAVTFYDKVGSSNAVTDKEQQFAKEIVYGESPVCKGSKNKNRGEKNATRRSKYYHFAFNMLIVMRGILFYQKFTCVSSLYTLLHLVALAPMKVWLLSHRSFACYSILIFQNDIFCSNKLWNRYHLSCC